MSGSILTSCALVFLSCQWSTAIKVWCTCVKVGLADDRDMKGAPNEVWRDIQGTLKAGNLIRIVPLEHLGRSKICPLEGAGKTLDFFNVQVDLWVRLILGVDGLQFEFQKQKFIFDTDRKEFRPTTYPVQDNFRFYKNSHGLNGGEVVGAELCYGLNLFDIPKPTFKELFAEHLVAPFFVFQLFCVALWFMDEYWYYSLFTLGMLFVFESTVVAQVSHRSLTQK